MRSPISVILLAALFCILQTTRGYPVVNPYSVVYPGYPLTYHHSGYAPTYQNAYQNAYQTAYQTAYQPGYPAGYQTVVVGLGHPSGHVQLVPTTVTDTRPVLVPLVPVGRPHRRPSPNPQRHDRPQVVHPTHVIRLQPDRLQDDRHQAHHDPQDVIDVVVDRKPTETTE